MHYFWDILYHNILPHTVSHAYLTSTKVQNSGGFFYKRFLIIYAEINIRNSIYINDNSRQYSNVTIMCLELNVFLKRGQLLKFKPLLHHWFFFCISRWFLTGFAFQFYWNPAYNMNEAMPHPIHFVNVFPYYISILLAYTLNSTPSKVNRKWETLTICFTI